LKKVDENSSKVDENQSRIVKLLMQMTRKGKGPETYENRKTGGSHGGNKYNPEYVPYHQSEGSHGRCTPHRKMVSVIAQFVAMIKGYEMEGQTSVTGTYPTQFHHDGEVLSL
jgi:hypothetical protein